MVEKSPESSSLNATRETVTGQLPVSVVIIALNEEANIARCLQSVSWAADLVVLDSGSQDRTVELARSLGARVFTEPWRGFRAQKQRAVELARMDWVISLDADEEVSPALRAEIFDRWSELTEAKIGGWETPRLSFYMGRWIRHGGWYPDAQVRLFHRERAKWVSGHVHERVGVQIGLTGRLNQDLWHYPFGDLAGQIQTNNRYSSLAAQDLKDRGVPFHLHKLVLKPIFKFLECYVWKRGLLDGLPGLIIAVGAGYSMFLKWAKLWELHNSSILTISRHRDVSS